MYNKIIRPLLFMVSPETIHHIMIGVFKVLACIPGMKWVIRKLYAYRAPELKREVFGLSFPNPVGLAAGFDKNGQVSGVLSSLGFGFVEVGTVTPRAQVGNPRPRLFRLIKDSALINRMGFNNAGVDSMLSNLRHRSHRNIIGGNLGKNTTTDNDNAPVDYLRSFRVLYEYVDYFVINVSCPNVASLTCLQDKDNLQVILKGLLEFRRGQNQYRPILLKISPDLTDEQLDSVIETVIEYRVDGVVATNTTVSREGLTTSEQEVAAIGKGGLSGGPLTQKAIRTVKYIHDKTGGSFPIIGVGGIMSEDEALAMLDAGASLIQIYTGFIYNGPSFVRRICKRIVERERSAQAKPVEDKNL